MKSKYISFVALIVFLVLNCSSKISEKKALEIAETKAIEV